jgi:uridine kinase
MILDPFGPQTAGAKARPRGVRSRYVALIDGVFLQRPELADCWEGRIWVEADEEERLRRALARDAARFGGEDVVRERYTRRYLPGQRLYAERCRPAESADVVVHNDDPERPTLSWR